MAFDERTYNSWRNMVQRCHNPADKKYRWYGGRGIVVCDRWRSLQNFLADMGERPEGKTIHRLDNDGNYEPGNCSWATRAEQDAHRGNILTKPKPYTFKTIPPADIMNFQQALDMAIIKAPLPAFERDLMIVVHKLRHPMAAILARVPGDTLAERARRIGVSRQTMYVWAQERFRPSSLQARIISNLTGVPVAQIAEYQEGKNETRDNGAGKPARKTAARVAKAGKRLSAGAARTRTKRGGMAAQQGNRRHDRTVVRRNQRRPRGGEGD
jgi:DNA-binding XRE family transcriptional regulator